MRSIVNEYDALIMYNSGTVQHMGPVRGTSKPEAARLMRCDLRDVKFVKHVRATREERVMMHCIRVPITRWRMNGVHGRRECS